MDPREPKAEGVEVPVVDAAVALIVASSMDAILLIRRAVREGDPWSGQMALPGGQVDPSDHDPVETAIRESREEVGIELGRHQVSTTLPAQPTIGKRGSRRFQVAPVVFRVDAPSRLSINAEVAEAFWIPQDELQRPENKMVHLHSRGPDVYRFPAFRIAGHPVWGLTYQILSLFFQHSRQSESSVGGTRDGD